MNTVFPLSTERYAGKSWLRASDWSFAASRPLIPVVILELSEASAAMPLAFVRHGNAYQLVAVLGIELDRSLAVDSQGRWQPAHCPLMLSTYPFILMDGKDGNQMVGIDEGTGLVGDDLGQPFFDDTGEPTEQVKKIVAQLKKVAVSRLATRKAVNALADAGLLDPLPVTVNQTKLEGLYHVSEKKLRDQSPDQIKALLESGALTVTFAHLFSLFRFAQLERWAKESKTPSNIDDIDISALFGEKDDLLKF